MHGQYVFAIQKDNIESKVQFTNNESTGANDFFNETVNLIMLGL